MRAFWPLRQQEQPAEKLVERAHRTNPTAEETSEEDHEDEHEQHSQAVIDRAAGEGGGERAERIELPRQRDRPTADTAELRHAQQEQEKSKEEDLADGPRSGELHSSPPPTLSPPIISKPTAFKSVMPQARR